MEYLWGCTREQWSDMVSRSGRERCSDFQIFGPQRGGPVGQLQFEHEYSQWASGSQYPDQLAGNWHQDLSQRHHWYGFHYANFDRYILDYRDHGPARRRRGDLAKCRRCVIDW